jgi:hypothetical protein
MNGQLSQDRFAAWRDLDGDRAAIELGATAPDHASADEPIHELDGGVVSDLQALGQHADRRHPAALDAFHLE